MTAAFLFLAVGAAAVDLPTADGPLLILPIEGQVGPTFEGELARALRNRLGADAVTTMAEVDVALSAERTRDVLGCTDVSCLAEILGALGGRWALGVTLVPGEPLSDVVVILRDLRDASRTFRLERRTPSLVSARLRDLAEDVAAGVLGLTGWRPQDVVVAPAAGGGTLRVNTIPTGAQLFLNDDPIGRAPANLSGLASGEYQLRAADIGFHTYEQTVRLEPGEDRSLDLELDLLRDYQVGLVLAMGFRDIEVALADGLVDGTLSTLGVGLWYEREILGPVMVGGSAGYHWTAFGVNSSPNSSDTFSSHHGMYAMAHASVGWILGMSGLASLGAVLDPGSAEETLEALDEINFNWPLFSFRLRAKLGFFTPGFVTGQLSVELGVMGLMHADIGWSPLLLRPSLPYQRDGHGIEKISFNAFAVNVVLGPTIHYRDPE